mgnify:CR=1 FL=1
MSVELVFDRIFKLGSFKVEGLLMYLIFVINLITKSQFMLMFRQWEIFMNKCVHFLISDHHGNHGYTRPLHPSPPILSYGGLGWLPNLNPI